MGLKWQIVEISFFFLLFGIAVMKHKIMKRELINAESQIYKLRCSYDLLYPWLCIKQNQQQLESYFMKYGFQNIAIYGMGDMGDLLYRDLKGGPIIVKCVIDQKVTHTTHNNLVIIKPDERLEKLNVDAIVVTPTFAFETIKKNLNNKTNIPVVSLGTILDEVRLGS